MAMSETELKTYLSEHLSYEVLMLRYTLKELHTTQPALRWNAMFEAFAVHARAMYDFLTNDKDARNVRAVDFAPEFKASKVAEAQGKINALQGQVFHPGKRRVDGDKLKLSVSDAERIGEWVEDNMDRFIRNLPRELDQAYRPEEAEPQNMDDAIILMPTKASATNHIIIERSGRS